VIVFQKEKMVSKVGIHDFLRNETGQSRINLYLFPLVVKYNRYNTAIQTLQRVGRGKAGGEWVWQLVWGKYLEETQGGHGLAGVFSGGKTIGVQPQSS
jgi:hypothetical protein